MITREKHTTQHDSGFDPEGLRTDDYSAQTRIHITASYVTDREIILANDVWLPLSSASVTASVSVEVAPGANASAYGELSGSVYDDSKWTGSAAPAQSVQWEVPYVQKQLVHLMEGVTRCRWASYAGFPLWLEQTIGYDYVVWTRTSGREYPVPSSLLTKTGNWANGDYKEAVLGGTWSPDFGYRPDVVITHISRYAGRAEVNFQRSVTASYDYTTDPEWPPVIRYHGNGTDDWSDQWRAEWRIIPAQPSDSISPSSSPETI